MANENRKQIAFDIDTKALAKYYPSRNWRKAYDDIKKHMCKNGFCWQQGLVYVSEKPMRTSDLTRIILNLIKENPWINKCMRDCRETNIGRGHSKNNLFNKDADILTREEAERHTRTYP